MMEDDWVLRRQSRNSRVRGDKAFFKNRNAAYKHPTDVRGRMVWCTCLKPIRVGDRLVWPAGGRRVVTRSKYNIRTYR